jgi:2',3'-cyclic-nucleotide 2'-phosphodiesterase (5'-nucleotidase family)
MMKTRNLFAMMLVLIGWALYGCAGKISREVPYTDIGGDTYGAAVASLYDRGYLENIGNPGGLFEPDKALTRAEAAVLIQRVFMLVPVTTVKYPDKNLERMQVYSGNLGIVTEAFTVPAAQDSADHWASSSIESLIGAGVIEFAGIKANGWNFDPEAAVSAGDFALWTARAIYGPEQSFNHVEKAVSDNYLPAPGHGNISRDDACAILDGLLQKGFKVITVFATADIHGNLIPYMPSGSSVYIGALARMSAIIEAHRKINPDTLLVDGGDSPYNSNIANLFNGDSTIDTMSAMKYDATVLGNHDFDYSLDNLERLANRASYPFLSLNTYMKDGSFPSFLKEYVIKEAAGLKIAITGMTDDTSKETTHFENTKDIEFKNDYETSRAVVARMIARERPDIVIALSHLHNKNADLPLHVPGIHVEIGGGMDVMGQPFIVNGTWIINPGKHAECLNQINLNIFGKKMVGLVFDQIVLNEKMPESPEIKAIVDSYAARMDDRFKTVVAQTRVTLDGERGTVRFKESNLGNIITDSQIAFFNRSNGATIALQNGGGIRQSVTVPEGAASTEITLGDINGILPFDNRMVVLEMSGKTLWDCIANGLTSYTGHGHFLHVGGLNYTAEILPEGADPVLKSVNLANGSPLDFDALYRVVVNDFMAGGGDGFTMINVLQTDDPALPVAGDVKLIQKTELLQRQIFQYYLEELKIIEPRLEGRIEIINH